MLAIDASTRRALRAQAHHLHPVVSIGHHGLTPAVLHEIDVNLLAHGLIKLRVFSDDRGEREALLARICEALDAAPVQHLGKVLVLYRPPQEEEKPAATPTRAVPRAARPATKVARGASAPTRGKTATQARTDRRPRDREASEPATPPRRRGTLAHAGDSARKRGRSEAEATPRPKAKGPSVGPSGSTAGTGAARRAGIKTGVPRSGGGVAAKRRGHGGAQDFATTETTGRRAPPRSPAPGGKSPGGGGSSTDAARAPRPRRRRG